MANTLIVLEAKWADTCKVIFGERVCGLEECSPWLSGFIEPISHNKSRLSGKEVISAPTDYCKTDKWLSFEEIDFNKTFEPLNINEIKDIDSLLEALGERMHYSGNVVFGKSGNIVNSSNLNDSFYIYEVGRFGNSKYLAYCTIGRLNDTCFGSNGIEESSYCIRCSRVYRSKRCFELWMSENCSDCHYSSGLSGCSNCMFTFNVKSKKYSIGNLELSVARYNEIKGKLLEEMAELLIKEKRLPSLMELVEKSKFMKPSVSLGEAEESEQLDMGKIEDSFSSTTSILFGAPLEGGVKQYAKWLTKHTRLTERVNSAASEKELYVPNAVNYTKLPKNRLLNQKEAYKLGESTSLSETDLGDISLKNVHEKIGPFAFFNVELNEGENKNNVECAACVNSVNNYRNSLQLNVKNSAYCFWPRDSSSIFGCDSPFDSAFSINCYSCTQLSRCFEIDCCGYCSDVYFGHNCENVHNAMFCFNTKNKRYVIGNSPLPADSYKKIKGALVSQIHDELSRKKDLKWDIYNVVCAR
ncbi:MAG: hypothetical protein ABIF01_04450 [Candidatus Micrarchaeota archaeon]